MSIFNLLKILFSEFAIFGFDFYILFEKATRGNLCVASESMFPGQVEGVADHLVQALAPFRVQSK